MGFTEAQAREALQHCRNNLVQATEHVLSLATQAQFTVRCLRVYFDPKAEFFCFTFNYQDQ